VEETSVNNIIAPRFLWTLLFFLHIMTVSSVAIMNNVRIGSDGNSETAAESIAGISKEGSAKM